MSIKAPFSLYRKRFYYSIKNPQNPLFCFQFFVFNMHLNNFVKSNLYNMDDQIKQIEDFAKFVLKDNKKEDKEKNENNKG